MSAESFYHPGVLDRQWFERLRELTFSDFELLDGDGEVREASKQQFLAGEIDNPRLDYPKLERFDFAGRESALLELKTDILEQEANEVVVKVYRTRINESIAQLRMLKAAKDGNDRAFSRYAEFVYGTPEGDLSDYATSFVAKKMDRFASSKHEVKRDAVAKLKELLGDRLVEVEEKAPSVEGEGLKGKVTDVDEAVSMFESYLEEEGIDDWAVVKTENQSITGFRVSQERKEMVVPTSQFTGEKGKAMSLIKSFIAHEGMHVGRRFHGERSKLALLGIGLDRVEKGEEGVATYTEQQVKGTEEYAHPQRYFAIAYAKGAIDGEPKNFRQTYDMLLQYYRMSLKPGDDVETRAEDWAWKLAVRVFRGTTGETPGAVYPKDMAYFKGNKETWELVSKDSDVVKTFSIGKFDAANERHVSVLMELGILDEDLQEAISYASETGSTSS